MEMSNPVFVLVLSDSNCLLKIHKIQNHSKGFMLHSVIRLQFSYEVLLLFLHNEKSIRDQISFLRFKTKKLFIFANKF